MDLIPTIITAAATVAAALISARVASKKKQGSEGKESIRTNDPIVRFASIIAAGFAVTAVVMLYTSTNGQILDLSGQVGQIPTQRTLEDFSSTRATIGSEYDTIDKDAKDILEGAGPKTWQSGQRNWQVGDVVYANRWEWIEVAFPGLDRPESAFPETCGLEPKGVLAIRGFHSDRRALIEYTAPGDSGGTPCDTGTFFFYPLPSTSS